MIASPMIVGRLAPTPSGHLHLGNALAFGAAWLSARAAGGRVLLRIEDIDRGRARSDVAAAQRDDMRWLGLDWDEEVAAQSSRSYSVSGAPVYFCDCNRTARLAGNCRCRDAAKTAGAVRFRTPPGEVRFVDRALGPQSLPPGDDPVLIGADGGPMYTLAVVTDDERDGVTEVVRGADLLDATPAQIRLGEALGAPVPTYLHTPILLGPDGKKLSKSHASTELRALRAAGWTPARVWGRLLPLLGLPESLDAARSAFDPARIPRGPFTVE
jgi:glutamyl/glutaminyl-tRNA synthetase